MRSAVMLAVVTTASAATASAEPQRYVVLASYGELEESPKPCGQKTREALWAWFPAGVGLRLEHGEESLIATTPQDLQLPSSRFFAAEDKVVATWHMGPRTLVVTLFPRRENKTRTFRWRSVSVALLTEADEKTRDQVTCFERWSGFMEVR